MSGASGVRVYTAEEQQRIFRAHAEQGFWRLGPLLLRNEKQLIKLAEERAMAQGLRDYGDATLHKSKGDLTIETFQELADAVFYQSVFTWIEKGRVLPVG